LVFIKADQAILDAYKDEAEERGIEELPAWSETMSKHIAYFKSNQSLH